VRESEREREIVRGGGGMDDRAIRGLSLSEDAGEVTNEASDRRRCRFLSS
jgi:hypothetical protein